MSFWKLVPLFLTRLISNYSFPQKFLFGSIIISVPIIVGTLFVYFSLVDHFVIRMLLLLFIFGLFVVLYLFFGAVYVSVMETIRELQKATARWKSGELSTRVEIKTNDEFKEIGQAFNEITNAYEEEIEEHKAVRFLIEQSMQKNNQLITAIDNLEIGVVITESVDNSQKVIYVNPGFENMTGYSKEEVIEKGLRILQGKDTSTLMSKKLKAAIDSQSKISLEILNYHKSGKPFWNYLSITPVFNENNQLVNFIGIMTDITKQKLSDEKIYELAYFDPLTNLSNLNFLKEYVTERVDKEDHSYAIFYIDIDRFKNLNSKLGYLVGNVVLKEFAERLMSVIKNEDGLLARATKDEYLLYVPTNTNKSNLKNIANKIMKVVSTSFTINHYEFYLGTSIGISIYPNDGENFDYILQNAETAMYQAKVNQFTKAVFYEKSMSIFYQETHELENQLKFAIERNELRLVYQPKICLTTGNIVGAEALVRWEHPTEGLISPAKFIPVAENTGLIFSLGSWVLNHACQTRKQWFLDGLGDFKLSVNISAKQFKEGYFIPLIEELLETTNLDPFLLEIELTESALHAEEQAKKLLEYLKGRNISVSIDDFGTGYSSLNYLRFLPINTLKIDRSFIIEMETSEKSAKLLESIISMGHSLSLNVIAEGVETKLQLLMLKEMGCNEIQGYFLSKPLFEEDFCKFILDHRPEKFLQYYNKVNNI